MAFLIDATISMDVLLGKLKLILPEVFDHTYEVLREKSIKDSGLQIKLVLYRNYNSDSKEILQSSAFENEATNLKMFLERARATGGWGNEAVEVAFQFINDKFPKVNEVILIADAPGN